MFSNVSYNFKGKRALVTGGARGIGKGIVLALKDAGAEVFALDVNKEGLQALSAEHPTIHTLCVDIRDWSATRKVVEEIVPIDLLVNNAGICFFENFATVTQEMYDRTMDINAKAVMNISQVVTTDLLTRKKPGAIVNISSQASMCAFKGIICYGASKAALDMIMKNMAFELGPHQIRVNSILPTMVKTDMSKLLDPNELMVKRILDRIPLGRPSEISEIVGPVLFLLSDAASMIHGHQLLVDGGYAVC